jgi:hypothetical protein
VYRLPAPPGYRPGTVTLSLSAIDRHFGKVNLLGEPTWGFPEDCRLSSTSILPTPDSVFPYFPTFRGLTADLAGHESAPNLSEGEPVERRWPPRLEGSTELDLAFTSNTASAAASPGTTLSANRHR